MRNLYHIRNAILGSILGGLVLVGTAISVNAQTDTKEYRDWQKARARAEQRHQAYMRTNSSWDHRQWQDADRQAQQKYSRYQQVSGRYSNGYDNDYNNRNYDTSRNDVNVNFRVYHDGNYYSTDSRGAELLRQAVRNGYVQGHNQGRNDRRYGRRYDYGNAGMYRSGTYGYQSYVARDQYQYYFQQGFQRGYEDGFNSTTRYGYRSDGSVNIIADVLNTIIDIAH